MKTTYRVLKMLKENTNEAMSGQLISEKLGVSRTAVWKAIKSLEDDGHKIVSLPARGYILEESSTSLSEENLRCQLPSPFDKSYIEIYDTSSSTNILAKEVMEKGEDACLIISREQTKGKGRFGKSFYSPRGGLYFSFAFRPENKSFDPSLLTMAIGVSLTRTFKDLYGVELEIKWVNDLFYKDRKVAGILTEGSFSMETGQIDYICCGIGINLTLDLSKLGKELEDIAGPIFLKLDEDFNVNTLIARIIENFMELKDSENIIDDYSKVCLNLGQEVVFTINEETYEGLARSISPRGELEVELKDGQRKLLSFGQARIKKKELK